MCTGNHIAQHDAPEPYPHADIGTSADDLCTVSCTVGVERCDSVYTVGSCGLVVRCDYTRYALVYTGGFTAATFRSEYGYYLSDKLFSVSKNIYFRGNARYQVCFHANNYFE